MQDPIEAIEANPHHLIGCLRSVIEFALADETLAATRRTLQRGRDWIARYEEARKLFPNER